MSQSTQQYAFKHSKLLIAILFVVCYPAGVYKIYQQKYALWAKALYIILGLPVFLIVFSYLTIVLLGAMLPELDSSVSPHLGRTVWNNEGNYSCTFVKTRNETGDAYELLELQLEPRGSNWWHYHTTFEEGFTVVKGEIVVETEAEKHFLKEGETFVVPKRTMHQFYNPTDSVITVLVRVTPAGGLEKTIRAAYGLINKGELTRTGATASPWQLFLISGYSSTYPASFLPTWIQEPFFDSLAKIAQWRGDDKGLEAYFF